MSKKAADLPSGGQPSTGFTATKRGPVAQRRASASARLAREARQQRMAYLTLFGVIGIIIVVLAGGALWDYVIYPAQALATVNGEAIRNDTFNRFQKLESLVENNLNNNLTNTIAQYQSDTKHAAQNQAIIQQLQQEQTTVQSNLSNIPAYTLQQMETAIELRQAAAKIGMAPTPAQLTAALNNLKKSSGATGIAPLLATGVTVDDLKTYYLMPSVVQTNVTKKLSKPVAKTEHQAQARHILVATKNHALALKIEQEVKAGASFAALAKKYSIDNGNNGNPITTTTELAAARQSSAYNGGWLSDPSSPTTPGKPGWLTPETQFVAPVLNAILSMKPGEIRLVQSQFGWHIIQVSKTRTYHFTKSELQTRQQQADQTTFQNWYSTATDSTKNKAPNPYTLFPTQSSSGH